MNAPNKSITPLAATSSQVKVSIETSLEADWVESVSISRQIAQIKKVLHDTKLLEDYFTSETYDSLSPKEKNYITFVVIFDFLYEQSKEEALKLIGLTDEQNEDFLQSLLWKKKKLSSQNRQSFLYYIFDVFEAYTSTCQNSESLTILLREFQNSTVSWGKVIYANPVRNLDELYNTSALMQQEFFDVSETEQYPLCSEYALKLWVSSFQVGYNTMIEVLNNIVTNIRKYESHLILMLPREARKNKKWVATFLYEVALQSYLHIGKPLTNFHLSEVGVALDIKLIFNLVIWTTKDHVATLVCPHLQKMNWLPTPMPLWEEGHLEIVREMWKIDRQLSGNTPKIGCPLLYSKALPEMVEAIMRREFLWK